MYTVVYQRPNAPVRPDRVPVPVPANASAAERERAYQASFEPQRGWERDWNAREDHSDRAAAIAACRDAYYAGGRGTQVFGPHGVEFTIYSSRFGGVVIEQERVEYVVCDSVGFAANGAPESAEAATTYFQAVRQFGPGVGSLHLAHVTKPTAEAPDPMKPFGSVFWHNSARSTWFIKRTIDTSDGSDTFSLAVIHRKANLGKLRPPVGLEITFTHDRANMRRIDVAEVEEFAKGLPVKLRVRQALKRGALTVAELVEETGEKRDTIEKALTRGKGRLFACITTGTPDGVHRWGLLDGRAS